MQRGEPVFSLALIGAGPAGLSAVFTALQNGISPEQICLCERADTLLGGWRHTSVPIIERMDPSVTWQSAQGGLNDHSWLEALDTESSAVFDGGSLVALRKTLLEQLNRAGVAIRTGAKALEIGRDYNNDFRAWFESGVPITAKRLILATGGGKNHGYRWAEEKSLSIQPFLPAGINLRLKESRKRTWGSLPPTKVQVGLASMDDRAEGSIEGPHPWLGGTALTRLSLCAPAALAAANYKGSIQINWLCRGQEGVSSKELMQFQEQAGRRTLEEYPWTGLEKTVWKTLLQRARAEPSALWRSLSQRELQNLASQFTRAQFKFEGYRLDRIGGLAAGGLGLEELVPGTFESKREAGLFWIGELVDLHASDPNANLWLAHLAGKNAADAVAHTL